MFEWTQERTFVITSKAIYNIHKKSIKRSIDITQVGGISKTVPPSKASEFAVHVPSSYDYRFISTKRDEIIKTLQMLYLATKSENCPIYCITAKDLKDFTTTENDMKKGRSKIPVSEMRSFNEDLVKDLPSPGLSK